ncbi:MAG: histidinol-phosphate transaminase [Gammaproteobacteria bacterium]|nr:histidinol-phosphate transaminase [Gammaproteobacteria bacterium]MDP2140642.1 histidinol-phosphate transaminase [Gammaproteobacteria bacterium]MDP2347414.1 histidinol-phosphate transaminase [Gammaproteobacteria bacterium]
MLNPVMNRRRLLWGGASLAGAALLKEMSGTRLISSAVAEITAPMEPIRMSSNENPYGPSQLAIEAMQGAFSKSNLYGGIGNQLVDLLARIEGVAPENVTISAGSGELLQAAGVLAAWEPGSIVSPYPTFGQLVRAAEVLGSEIINVPVDEKMHIDLDAMYAAIRPDTRMIYLCNPNNPIPSIIEKKALEDFVRTVARDRLVFIDEAYYEYVDNPEFSSMMPLVAEGLNNVIIARTASKIHGFAGLRVGMGYAHPDLIAKLNKVKTGSISVLSQYAAYVAYQDMEFQDFSRARNKEGLAIVEGMCDELGLRYIKSNANFAFFETGIDSETFRAAMREHNIMVGRTFDPYPTWARVSMAKPEEMAYFVQTYKKLYT